jgi:phage protein D
MIELIYEGKDINLEADVAVTGCVYTDCVHGRADSVRIAFSDAQKLWRLWAPQKGDAFEVRQGAIRSGKMYVSKLIARENTFVLAGSATPLSALGAASESWENIRLSELVSRMAAQVGMTAELSGVPDRLYARFDRVAATVPAAIQFLCRRESAALKAFDGRFLLLNERKLEQAGPVACLKPEDMTAPEFGTSDAGLLHEVTVQYVGANGQITGRWADGRIAGGTLAVETPVSSQGEAERFARGFLRAANRRETAGAVTVLYDDGIAAGNVVEIQNYGSFSGRYCIDSVRHDMLNLRMRLGLRKPIQGDY